MSLDIVRLVFVICVSCAVNGQEWTFSSMNGGHGVNPFENARPPIRPMNAVEAPPSYWNIPMQTAASLNDYGQAIAANQFGQMSNQIPNQPSPLYSVSGSMNRPAADLCCISPTTEQMAKDIAETLKVMRSIATSLEMLNSNFNQTLARTQSTQASMPLGSAEMLNAKKAGSSPTMVDNNSNIATAA